MNYSMNGTEQENARMSLANDILKHTGSLMPSNQTVKREPLSYPRKTKRPEHKPKDLPKTDIPGVSYVQERKTWKAYFYDGNRSLSLGEFKTPERAGLAVALYKFWRKRGFHTSEHRKPSFTLYRRASDYS